jgi:opine dehydrogenase
MRVGAWYGTAISGRHMRIAVLGGGNGSHAAAADLSDQGHEVRFWRRDAARFG